MEAVSQQEYEPPQLMRARDNIVREALHTLTDEEWTPRKIGRRIPTNETTRRAHNIILILRSDRATHSVPVSPVIPKTSPPSPQSALL